MYQMDEVFAQIQETQLMLRKAEAARDQAIKERDEAREALRAAAGRLLTKARTAEPHKRTAFWISFRIVRSVMKKAGLGHRGKAAKAGVKLGEE